MQGADQALVVGRGAGKKQESAAAGPQEFASGGTVLKGCGVGLLQKPIGNA
jgi:hypothetical protein